MERLTEKVWRNLDPWECCGQDEYCRRDGHEDGGCTKGCIVPKLYSRLAKYEDLDLLPGEIREKLRKLEWYEAKFGHRQAQRWDQIAAAEDEGRLVVLTCKVGDKVYQVDAEKVYESTVTSIIIGQNAPIIYDTDGGVAFNDRAIGHSIFLNSWEAERALEGK
mgnify:CR=1 FL=1